MKKNHRGNIFNFWSVCLISSALQQRCRGSGVWVLCASLEGGWQFFFPGTGWVESKENTTEPHVFFSSFQRDLLTMLIHLTCSWSSCHVQNCTNKESIAAYCNYSLSCLYATVDGQNIQTSRKRLDWPPLPQMSSWITCAWRIMLWGLICFVHPSQPLEEENKFEIWGARGVKMSRVWIFCPSTEFHISSSITSQSDIDGYELYNVKIVYIYIHIYIY